MAVRNALNPDAVVSLLFSVTPDLSARFPSSAARELGWVHVPMLDVTQVDVGGALSRCIRVLMHTRVIGDLPQDGPKHVYLGDAASLRPDLAQQTSPEAIS
jgi:chorismate mutase